MSSWLAILHGSMVFSCLPSADKKESDGIPRMSLFLPICVTAITTSACATTSPTAPGGNQTPSNTVSYSAVGASDAIGYGSSVPCIPFADCSGGKGYVQLI